MDLNEEDYHRHASHHHAPFYSVSPFTTTTTARSSTPPPYAKPILFINSLNLFYVCVLKSGFRGGDGGKELGFS
ncbi:hypothetical protein YC2023_048396 [Brassica napus]